MDISSIYYCQKGGTYGEILTVVSIVYSKWFVWSTCFPMTLKYHVRECFNNYNMAIFRFITSWEFRLCPSCPNRQAPCYRYLDRHGMIRAASSNYVFTHSRQSGSWKVCPVQEETIILRFSVDDESLVVTERIVVVTVAAKHHLKLFPFLSNKLMKNMNALKMYFKNHRVQICYCSQYNQTMPCIRKRPYLGHILKYGNISSTISKMLACTLELTVWLLNVEREFDLTTIKPEWYDRRIEREREARSDVNKTKYIWLKIMSRIFRPRLRNIFAV